MPKSRTKKKNDVIIAFIPEKPTANLTSAMRTELYATPELFENTTTQTSSKTTKESERTSETKISEISSKEEILPKKAEKEVSKRSVTITKVNDVQIYDADVIGTFSQSSGTISYDSIRSMKNESLKNAQINGKYIENTDKKLHKIALEQVLKDGSSIPKMSVISDIELDRLITGQEAIPEDRKAIRVTPLWGLYETILTKKCINEAVENFFASPRDDIELTMRLSRRDIYPRLHIELAPIYENLQIEASHFQKTKITPFDIRKRRRRFDDLLRREDLNDYQLSRDFSMQSMESRSASMCCAQSSDATTARSPNHDYLSSACSYLVAFVKSVISNRRQTSTKINKDNNK
ncbi:Spindle assembly checkpoint component MAD3 [Dirofilaria immitis]